MLSPAGNVLYEIWDAEYQAVCKKETNEDCRRTVRFILERNILCGNALSLKTVDENGADIDQPIVFSEWAFVMGTKMQRKDYRFDKLLAGDYNASETVKGRKKKEPDNEQISFFEEKPDDEGELLTTYIADYRRIWENG